MRRRPFLWLCGVALIACANLWAEEGKDPVFRWSFDTLDGNWTRIENANLADGVHCKALDCRDTVLELPADFIPGGWKQISFSAWVFPRRFSSYEEIFRKEDNSNRLLFSFQEGGRILSIGANIGGAYTE